MHNNPVPNARLARPLRLARRTISTCANSARREAKRARRAKKAKSSFCPFLSFLPFLLPSSQFLRKTTCTGGTIFLIVALLMGGPLIASWAQSSGLQSVDLYQLRSVGDTQISPDGTRIAYSVTNNDRPGSPYSQLWLMEVASGKATQVEGASGGARWSPDGKLIACFGRVMDKS